MKNPWRELPDKPPFVLPRDAAVVSEFNTGARPNHFLQIEESLPAPFVGNRHAPVLLLSNNPGFGDKGKALRNDPKFVSLMRANLHHGPLSHPFIYLDPELERHGNRWWGRKLKHLINEFGSEVIARSVLNVVFFPYPSRRYGHGRIVLESQKYSFQLVREAMERKATIVFMRKPKKWFDHIPELEKYARAYPVNNFQNPAVSPKNCDEYKKVVRALAKAT